MKTKFNIIILIAALIFCAQTSYALERDLTLISEGEYFSIYGPEGLDVRELLSKLNYRYFLQVDLFLDEGKSDPRGLLAKTLDSLYLEASDVLGIHVYSFHGNLEIYPDKASLNSLFQYYTNQDFREGSYYFHEKNTIYISYPDLTLGMLGHEIAHAIISNYFVVLPPPKVQEILSGYVDYSLQKQSYGGVRPTQP